MAKRRRRVALGDVYALPLTDGEALFQVIGRYARTASWAVRVVDVPLPLTTNVVDTRIAELPDRYVIVMTSLETDEHDGRVRFLINTPVPKSYEDGVPLFKANSNFDRNDAWRLSADSWWLDDGTTCRRVGQLEARYQRLPSTTLYPASVLRDHIERGWNPAWQFDRSIESEFARPKAVPTSKTTALPVSRFYLNFEGKTAAEGAVSEINLKLPEFQTSLDCEAEDDSILVQVSTSGEILTLERIEEIEETLEAIATRHHGTFDGNELPIGI